MPSHDASVPPVQTHRLCALGRWLAVLSLVAAQAAHAQTISGDLVVRVVDASDLIVASASLAPGG